MSRTLIMDDLNVNFSSCRENGIEVTSWQGDRDDRQLLNVLSVLAKVESEASEERGWDRDLRKLVGDNRKYLEQMLERA